MVDAEDRVTREDAERRDALVPVDQVDARHGDEVAGVDPRLKQVDDRPSAAARVKNVQLRPAVLRICRIIIDRPAIERSEDVRVPEQLVDDVNVLVLVPALEPIPRPMDRAERDALHPVPVPVDPLATLLVLILIGVDHLDEDAVAVQVPVDPVSLPVEEVHRQLVAVVDLRVTHLEQRERHVVGNADLPNRRRERRLRVDISELGNRPVGVDDVVVPRVDRVLVERLELPVVQLERVSALEPRIADPQCFPHRSQSHSQVREEDR